MKTLLSIACLVVLAMPAFGQMPDRSPRISVNGEATVYVQPDKILINLGIETWDMEMMAAKQKNNDILAKAIKEITSLGVKEKDIQTDQLTIEPRWNERSMTNRRTPEEFSGYFVRNSLVVTLTDATKVEELLTKVLEAGVNFVHGVDFQSTEFKKHREEAREMALKAAKEKAEKMAAVLDQKIGTVLEIIDQGGGTPWYGGFGGGGGGFGGGSRGYAMAQNAVTEVGGGETDTSIALGKIAITANVHVSFELQR